MDSSHRPLSKITSYFPKAMKDGLIKAGPDCSRPSFRTCGERQVELTSTFGNQLTLRSIVLDIIKYPGRTWSEVLHDNNA